VPDISKLTTRKVAQGPLPTGDEVQGSQLLSIPVSKIRRSPFQPRKHFSEERRQELRASIRERGLVEPVTLEPDPNDAGFYWLISGENRWRAHLDLLEETGDAKWSSIAAIVRPSAPASDSRADALISNLQRASLTPLEEGDGYRNMAKEDGLTAEQIAKKVGLGSDRIERCMRIAAGPEALRQAMEEGIRVPKLDAEGKPEVRLNPDGSVKMQLVQSPRGEKEIPEPVLMVRVIRELTIAEEMAKLYSHLVREAPKNQPKWAEREFRKHLEYVLMHDLEKRRVVEYVKRIRTGGRGAEKQAKEVVAEKPLKLVSLPRGTPFVSNERQLFIQKDALADMTPAQRAALRAELTALLRELPEERTGASSDPGMVGD
jgi:ParB/RepB/Spo0J family partition protein